MDRKLKQRFEYEEQFFGFSSAFFLDSFKGVLTEELDSVVEQLVDNIKGKLLGEARNPEDFELKLIEMKIALQTCYTEAVKEVMSKNSNMLFEYFDIPKHILLKEDTPVREGLAINPEVIENEIVEIKEKLSEMTGMKQLILEEVNEAVSTNYLMEELLARSDPEVDFLSDEVNEMVKTSKLLEDMLETMTVKEPKNISEG